jgi:Fe-S cluster assembly protein SufD
MIAVKESEGLYLTSFSRLEKHLAGSGRVWLERIRQEAIASFADLGFPTTHHEEWKYTSVAPIAGIPFEPARFEPAKSLVEKVKGSPWAELECRQLAFVNGRYCPELSELGTLPRGVKVSSLAEALKSGDATLENHLARYAAYRDHAFVALNTAFMEDGAFIEVPKGVVLEKPIYLLFVSVGSDQPTVSHPRNLILVGRESQVSIIEGYVGLGEEVYFTNAVTEVVGGENAVIEYHKLQQESRRSFHIATLQLQQDRSCRASTHTLTFGAALDREEVCALLGGEGAESYLNGLYITSGQQHVDNHTTIDHAKPHCASRELYKGVLDGKSRGVFNGKIIVRKDAQKTDSRQTNKNLLLSEDAAIDTKPQLEIYADDVKCTHGATIGQIDPEAVFYLRSRGIGKEEARSLLTYAFANDIIDKIKFEPLRALLRDELFGHLARGQKAEGM